MKKLAVITVVAMMLASCDGGEPEVNTPVITITAQPTSTTAITAGSVGNLTVTASVTEGATLFYQWYENTAASTIGGTAINGATNATFALPTTLEGGKTYFYFCELSATGNAVAVRSSVAQVVVGVAPVKTISVDVQVGTLTAGMTGTAAFKVTTANIADGEYNATVANRPVGVSVHGKVNIAGNEGILTLAADVTTAAGTTATLTLTIDGVTSTAFTLTVNAQILPALTTTAASEITATTVTLGGNIVHAGEPAYTERGVCYANSQNPTIADLKTPAVGTGTGNFTAEITGLTPNTVYYARAYAIHQTGTEYGAQVSFATSAQVTPVNIDMVSVSGGVFTMGSPFASYEGMSFAFSRPQHLVTLSSFSIGKYTVTQAQWLAVMGSHPMYEITSDNLPVVNVSWDDIVGTSGVYMELKGIKYYENGFIYKLNQKTGKNYRLPTESEWEYAARGGNSTNMFLYSGSNDINDVSWYNSNSDNKVHPVGGKTPNELGIYDMSGNVLEYCSDWADYYTADAKTDPTGPPVATNPSLFGNTIMTRGGSFNGGATNCNVYIRTFAGLTVRVPYIGFRLVL